MNQPAYPTLGMQQSLKGSRSQIRQKSEIQFCNNAVPTQKYNL